MSHVVCLSVCTEYIHYVNTTCIRVIQLGYTGNPELINYTRIPLDISLIIKNMTMCKKRYQVSRQVPERPIVLQRAERSALSIHEFCRCRTKYLQTWSWRPMIISLIFDRGCIVYTESRTAIAKYLLLLSLSSVSYHAWEPAPSVTNCLSAHRCEKWMESRGLFDSPAPWPKLFHYCR